MYFDLSQTLIEQKRYSEVLSVVEMAEKELLRYEESVKRLTPDTRATILEMYAELYIATGEYDKAEACCNAMDSLAASPRASWNDSHRRVKIYESRKQYEPRHLTAHRSRNISTTCASKTPSCFWSNRTCQWRRFQKK
jgi:hypothetical protein